MVAEKNKRKQNELRINGNRGKKDRTAETAEAYEMEIICDMNALCERPKQKKIVENKKYSNPIYFWVRFIQWQEFT